MPGPGLKGGSSEHQDAEGRAGSQALGFGGRWENTPQLRPLPSVPLHLQSGDDLLISVLLKGLNNTIAPHILPFVLLFFYSFTHQTTMRDPSKYILQGQSSLMNNGKNSIPPFIPSSRKHRALLFKLWCETGSPRCYLGAHQNCRISGLASGRLNRHLHSSKVPRMLHVHLSLRSTGLEGKVNGRVNHFISIRDQRRYDLKYSSGLNLALLPRLQILWYLSFEGKNSKDQIISLICFSNRLWEPSLPQA